MMLKNTIFISLVILLQFLLPATAQPNGDDGRRYRELDSEQNFRPSMTVTIIVLAVACVFIAFISFYIRRCSHNIHIQGGSIRLAARTRPAPQGLQASVVETFPTFLYSVVKGLKIGKGVLECAVCLNEFEDDETLRMLPKCDHVFHPECIDAWLSSHTTCPVCRADLMPDATEDDVTQLEETNNNTPETDTSSQGESDDTRAIAPQLQSSVSIRVTDDDIPVRSKSRRGGIFGKFPRSHSTGHMAAAARPGNHDRFTLKLPEDVRRQIMNGKLNRTTSCVVYPRQGSVNGWTTGRSGSVRNINGQSDPVGGKSDRWGFLRATSFLWRNNSTARKSVKKGEGSVAGWADGVGMVRSSSTRPPV